jgi:predicted transcriptional regulator
MKVLVLVALRENAVLMTIEKLQAEGKPITYEIIGRRLNCSYATVQRAVSNLIKSNLVSREGTPNGGYTYTILERTG